MQRPKSILILILLGAAGAFLFHTTHQSYLPQSSVNFAYSRNEIVELARDYLATNGHNTDGLSSDANFVFDSETAIYLQHRLGNKRANALLRSDSLMAHSWRVYFFDRSLPPSQMKHQFRVWLTPSGKIMQFRNIISDSTRFPSLNSEEARTVAIDFLTRHGQNIDEYRLQNSSVNQLVERKDYTFTWVSKDTLFGLSKEIFLNVTGDQIGEYRVELNEPESFKKIGSRMQTISSFIVTAASVLVFLLLIFTITLFLKKYHDGEVGIKTGIYVFVVLFATIFLEHCLTFSTIGYGVGMGDVNRFNVRIIVFFISVFIVQTMLAAMVFASWSVGESSARRGWSEKVKAIDGLQFGKPFTLEMSTAILRGYSFGFIMLGIILGALILITQYHPVGTFLLDLHGIPESISPGLSAVLLALRIALLNELVFRFFFIAWLREKRGNVWPGLILSAFFWSFFAFNLWDFPLGYVDLVWQFPLYFVIGLVLGLIVLRYDVMTALVANFVILALSYAPVFLSSSASFYEIQKYIFYILMAVPLGVAIVGYIKRQKFQFSVDMTPTHIRRISERERMARELEIARTVQMSLLPKQNPLAEGYDIAGICIPALEVGGDYYDFFQLGDGKIGIAIGDVSGKGVPAAIYMTLTKGILQSYASENLSPRDVLTKLNRQMYANIERNSFVSMFYAVLDMKRHKIRFSRAGHNPAILAQRSTDSNTLIQPRGIALGLEGGVRFGSFLEEHEMPLQSGDVLVFYTDGFTEATNEGGEEFSEERLEKIISENKLDSANIILQKVVRRVKQFVGSHPQHDDMTMVVLKVL